MYLGLDLGTSSLKAVVIDDDQKLICESSAPLEIIRPQSGWSEQDPGAWIQAAESAIANLPSDVRAKVRAIGLSGQMHGATILDASDEPLFPCILWNDTRSSTQASSMDADSIWRNITGNIVFPGFTAPKLSWLRDEAPETFDKIRKVLLPKDYLRLWLTGEYVTEMSDAAGTSWLDTEKRDWSDILLKKSSLTRDHMPLLIEGNEASGTLRAELALRFGMAEVPVAGGGGDNAASAIGLGVTDPGQGFVSLGTSGVLFAATDVYHPDPATAVHTFCHVLPSTWHQMGVILSCTDTLNWAASLLGEDTKFLTSGLGTLKAPGKGLFMPYLSGERTPHADANIRGGWIGLEHQTDQAAMVRAVLEGITFAFVDCRDALAATGTELETLLAVGGGTGSDYWLQCLATALNIPLQLPVAADIGAAFGAARLAMMCAGHSIDHVTKLPTIERTIEPVTSLTSNFNEAHGRYKAFAQTLKELS